MTPRDSAAKEQERAAHQAGDEAAQAVKDETGIGDKPPSDPQQLRKEIEEAREELGETVEALAQKADVKARTQEKIAEGKEQLREAQQQVRRKVEETAQRQVPLGAAVAAFLGALLLWLLRRR
jgi:methyl-accepting chemotaxis protein